MFDVVDGKGDKKMKDREQRPKLATGDREVMGKTENERNMKSVGEKKNSQRGGGRLSKTRTGHGATIQPLFAFFFFYFSFQCFCVGCELEIQGWLPELKD